jgi:hypothetical protein
MLTIKDMTKAKDVATHICCSLEVESEEISIEDRGEYLAFIMQFVNSLLAASVIGPLEKKIEFWEHVKAITDGLIKANIDYIEQEIGRKAGEKHVH